MLHFELRVNNRSRQTGPAIRAHPQHIRKRGSPTVESRAERKQRTREALLEAALGLLDDRSFGSLSLREVTRDAGIVPAGFYRHFQDMDELSFALVDESFRRLRQMLRAAREDRPDYKGVIHSSVVVLARNIHDHRLHFRFLVRERNGGVPALRRAIRGEIRLFSNELALYLARFPELHAWRSDDVQMVAMLMVETMVAAVESLLDASGGDPLAEQEVIALAEKQLRLITIAIPQWRSSSVTASIVDQTHGENGAGITGEERV
jgi:AcrR family transcriptional regulator